MSYLFGTKWSFMETGPQKESYEGQESLTQPDEVMTIKEMLARHARGLPVQGGREGVYIDEELGYIPDPATLDLVEIKEWQDRFKARHDEIKKSQDDAKREAKESADFERLKKKYEKEKSSDKDGESPKDVNSPRSEREA